MCSPAKGILMHRNGLDELQAFNLLIKASQETSLKWVDVSRWLVGKQRRATRPAAATLTLGSQGDVMRSSSPSSTS